MKEDNPLISNTVTAPTLSPDLLIFRLNQLDDGMKQLNGKLDMLTNNFATKEELHDINKRLDNWQWYWRSLVGAVLLALATSVASLLVFHGVK